MALLLAAAAGCGNARHDGGAMGTGARGGDRPGELDKDQGAGASPKTARGPRPYRPRPGSRRALLPNDPALR
jgi:hypothetical protein